MKKKTYKIQENNEFKTKSIKLANQLEELNKNFEINFQTLKIYLKNPISFEKHLDQFDGSFKNLLK